jgi:hypothetical protein
MTTSAIALAMKRFLVLLLLAAVPLQGLATLVTHTFDNGHGAPATLVHAHSGQQDDAAGEHAAPFPPDDTASCCLFAGFCHGTPGLIARFWFPHGTELAVEPVLLSLSFFTSFPPESAERPPSAVF